MSKQNKQKKIKTNINDKLINIFLYSYSSSQHKKNFLKNNVKQNK